MTSGKNIIEWIEELPSGAENSVINVSADGLSLVDADTGLSLEIGRATPQPYTQSNGK